MKGPRAFLTITACATVLACCAALADTVKLAKTDKPYENVTILDVSQGLMTFRDADSKVFARSLGEVVSVAISDDADYNQAEQLLAQKEYDKAAEAFAAAGKGMIRNWKQGLVTYRQMKALELGGHIDKALGIWLAMMDAASEDIPPGLLTLRPRMYPPKGSPAIDKAVILVQAKQGRVKSPMYSKELEDALAELRQRQLPVSASGPAGAAAGGAAAPAGAPAASAAPAVATSQPGQPPQTTPLEEARMLYIQGQYGHCATVLEDSVRMLAAHDLPTAFLLLGQSQYEVARNMGSGDQGEILFKRAGLNLMRVVSYYPDSPEAPVALLLAGQINEKLGNASAARLAYEKVTTTYRDSEAAKKAAALLAAMQKPAGQPAAGQTKPE